MQLSAIVNCSIKRKYSSVVNWHQLWFVQINLISRVRLIFWAFWQWKELEKLGQVAANADDISWEFDHISGLSLCSPQYQCSRQGEETPQASFHMGSFNACLVTHPSRLHCYFHPKALSDLILTCHGNQGRLYKVGVTESLARGLASPSEILQDCQSEGKWCTKAVSC